MVMMGVKTDSGRSRKGCYSNYASLWDWAEVTITTTSHPLRRQPWNNDLLYTEMNSGGVWQRMHKDFFIFSQKCRLTDVVLWDCSVKCRLEGVISQTSFKKKIQGCPWWCEIRREKLISCTWLQKWKSINMTTCDVHRPSNESTPNCVDKTLQSQQVILEMLVLCQQAVISVMFCVFRHAAVGCWLYHVLRCCGCVLQQIWSRYQMMSWTMLLKKTAIRRTRIWTRCLVPGWENWTNSHRWHSNTQSLSVMLWWITSWIWCII